MYAGLMPQNLVTVKDFENAVFTLRFMLKSMPDTYLDSYLLQTATATSQDVLVVRALVVQARNAQCAARRNEGARK